MSKVKTAIVIGGGIAGPVTAMALRKAGIEATIHEAYPGPADGIGGTLALAPNGLAALGIVGAKEAVAAAAQPITQMVMSVGGKHLALPHLPDVGPLQLLHRSDLHRALHTEAVRQGINFAYGKRLTAVEETPTGVIAKFADSSDAKADVLIGADGVRSTVRTLIDPNAPGAKYTGLLGLEATAGVEVPGEPGTMTFAFGKHAYYLYWRSPGGRTGWGANLPQDRPMSLIEARDIPPAEWMKVLRDAYGEDMPGGELVRHSDVDSLQVVGSLHIMPKVPHWHRGRMVLVGDSVHAPSNSSGQGASLAIESSIQLARCLRDISDVPSAFATYERLRRQRVEKVAARAARINQAKAPGAFARAMMPVLMPLLMKTAMKPEKTIGPEQRYRIDWDAPVSAGSAE